MLVSTYVDSGPDLYLHTESEIDIVWLRQSNTAVTTRWKWLILLKHLDQSDT